MGVILATLFVALSFGVYLYVNKSSDVLDRNIVLVDRISEINSGNVNFCVDSSDCVLKCMEAKAH